MGDFMTFICPNSPYVWNGQGFSECFEDMVLGFGANVVSVVIIFVLGIMQKKRRGSRRVNLSVKFFLHFLPAIGACLSVLDMFLLNKKQMNGESIPYNKWFASISESAVWINVILFSKCANRPEIFFKSSLCYWWMLKPVLGVFHLLIAFSASEAWTCTIESFAVLLNIVFGTAINFLRIKKLYSENSLLEDSLLCDNMDVEEGCPENTGNSSNFWDVLTFKCITFVMNRGVVKQLDFEDLLRPPSDMNPSSCHYIMLNCWHDQLSRAQSNPSLFRAICCAYGWPYVLLGAMKVVNDCIGFAGPLLLNRLVRCLEEGSRSSYGYVLAISLGLASITKSFLDTQYTFHLSKLRLKLRSSVMTLIYQKCLCMSLAERSNFSDGEIQTFMSVDADRTVNLCNSLHDVWSLPLQIGIALYLLYIQVKFAFISGMAITILLIPVNKWIAKLIATATEEMMKHKDERIRRTGELLTYIRTLKMYGWELLFCSWLKETRSAEVKHLATRKYLDAWCVFFWATTPTLFSLFTFGLFTLTGHHLDAATVFTCLALFNSLISPLNSFPWVINGIIDAVISMRRLSRFLRSSEPDSISNQSDPVQDFAIFMDDACCVWSRTDKHKSDLALNHVTLSLSKGSYVAVIGEVGSGKSSLLCSILGETKLVHGSIHSNGSIAYAPQVPWILSGTIRDNILFGKKYDPKRYLNTLRACALEVDISLMVGGDMAYIGEKGVNLSGGQRTRLALARAMYQDSDIVLLDDVLSAVDAQVAQWILNNAILGPPMIGKTRILCTHNMQAISSADMIVVLEKGCLKWVGSSTELSFSSHLAASPLKELVKTLHDHGEASGVSSSEVENDAVHVSEDAEECIEVELRKSGKVEFRVYKIYAMFSGWFVAVVICLSAILMQASRNGNDLWLSYWVDTTRQISQKYSISFYLAVLCVFCIINSLLTLVRAFSFAFGGLRAAVKVHNRLLTNLVSAPVQFFNQTPGGRILNRFSSDLYTIDDSLPFILNILLANLVGLLGIALVLSYVQVVFLLLVLPFWYIYSKLQFFYRSTSRELRRLDSVSRSPIYSSFTETLDGSSTVRAFNSEDFFFSRFTEHVALYQQTSYTEVVASLWLSLRLQLLAAFVVSFIASMSIIGSDGSLPISFSTPALVGLALSYAAPIVSLLGSFLTSFTETEKEMVSIERVLEYMDIPQEELLGCQPVNPDWPSEGLIEFHNVTLRYMPSLPPALHDITFTIAGRTQVGIIGRTGAGKSSVLTALFRMTPICSGSILVDHINIANVAVRDLRSHIAVVPQSPFLFEGSIRENLDPFKVYDDWKILKILEKCHVKKEIEAAGGLDIHIKRSGMSFSVGQRQLLCLARALLKSSKVLCLDECTANVDSQTATLLQNAISNECRGMTVVTIAHRISTILNMDNIFILDRGKLVEQGNPRDLLQDGFSKFSSFARASTM